ncbi:MAG: FAD-dependent oxidoreductase [Clostridia bacterium]|nr:FAD-dependent oxidoreductase [Clostridia bacterium]
MKNTYDVIVVGGGFSGFAAAIAAAREGSSVLLIEQYNSCGGAAVYDLVYPFMKNRTVIDGKRRLLSGGIFTRFTDNMRALGAIDDDGRHFDTEYMKLVMNRMLRASGVTLLYNAAVIDAGVFSGLVTFIKVHTVSGNSVFYGSSFIDGTGDANLAAMAGFGYSVGRESDGLCQPMTLCFRLANVKKELVDKKAINELYDRQRHEGKLRNPRENVLIFDYPAPGILHFNTTRVVKLNPTDDFDVTAAEIEAREQMFEMLNFLKENFEAFREAVVIDSGIRIGARESRMIKGLYTLTKDDIMSCTHFADGIAACNYDIDIHSPDGTGTSHYFFPAGCYYTIPYRCLVPAGSKNLIVAGRCISCDHDAQASLRIMPVCCTLGEAAGTAASMSIKNDVLLSRVDTEELREKLRAFGCIVD